jgi:hypothetical protein
MPYVTSRAVGSCDIYRNELHLRRDFLPGNE